ncbi:CASTOR/POLLUX-related putative ion channel [Streptomyces dangxiongensis]|uniref:CASTOR/POLLUX-related putative ion channel n=1 Tax=Streptomyces dangxiongensis TaxID=1442032 RepID=UPI001F0966A9|nr:NAD-binding lipoprotein [Streptomyces dangxiongensis]
MRRRHASLRDRARYLFDTRLARSTGTLLGWLALGCLVVVVPVSILLVWMDPSAPRSLSGRLAAVWRTSAETLRLGVATGTPLRMLLSVLLGLIALLCVSTLTGVITTGLGDRLAELRRGRSTVLERDHVVVLGWSEHVFTVVAELTAARGGRGRGIVAVFADRDTAEMEKALAAVPAAGGARLVCRTGALTAPGALALVAPAVAESVLVLPAEDTDADLEVVRVLLALRSLTATETGPAVVAAVRDGRYLPAARLAAGPRGVVLETDTTTARLLVQSAWRPGLPAVLHDLLDVAGAEFHVIEAPGPAGPAFAETALRLESACLVGIMRADGSALLAPGPETVLGAGDRLVVVAHDDTAPAPADSRAHIDQTAMAPPGPGPQNPARVLLLGWNRRAPLIADILRRTARPGAVLDVVTDPDDGLVPGHVEGLAGTGWPGVTHHVGDLARPETLRALDLFGYDSVIVLGPDADAGSGRPDDRALLTLLMLRAQEEEAGRALPVVAELCDHRSRALAPLGPASDAVVRGELTALLMAQISLKPTLATVFEEVFSARGGGLGLRPAGLYVRPGREATFATVVAASLRRGECAIGYRAHLPRTAHRHDGIRLAPGKSERRVWAAEDEVVVLSAAPRASDAETDAETDAGGAEPDALPRMRRPPEADALPSDRGPEEDPPTGRPPARQ